MSNMRQVLHTALVQEMCFSGSAHKVRAQSRVVKAGWSKSGGLAEILRSPTIASSSLCRPARRQRALAAGHVHCHLKDQGGGGQCRPWYSLWWWSHS